MNIKKLNNMTPKSSSFKNLSEIYAFLELKWKYNITKTYVIQQKKY